MDYIIDACMSRFNEFLFRLRPHGSPSVPSDDLRRRIMVEQFAQLVRKRRAELERLAKVTGGSTPSWLLN
ncbi:MAG TPA: hypothetical protein VGG45_04590 [Terracidiphilus sp.]|jgi:hypothetical protein